MNTPNKLTFIRVLLVPVFMWAFLRGFDIAAIVIFAVAALTDQLDGHLARKNNQVTTFGKLMDPIADKVLTIAALVCFVEAGADFVNSWVVMLVIARELIVTGIRLIALGENQVIAASGCGKAKTVSQMAAIIAVMVDRIVPLRLGESQFLCLTFWLIALMVVLTIYSGVDYVVKNRRLITFK
ncbi:MAG: CDP-diacylglycerol--glycerol-3-phosphate 3-phosphatidyltransferase [Clostridia bacterium]|nr:CDP-diacylglycerol--glycerol-3-phosphate 3-phosphatidyltransferase [Clostridia bacterium]